MEPAQQNQLLAHPNDADSSGGSGKGGSFLCRQSSTRWTPTTDQIRILKDLYYNNGVRSPNADQIQRISARLRQYGKIEGKNVFYWFQNHKARERQKKRFTSTTTDLHHAVPSMPMQSRPTTLANAAAAASPWKPDHHHSLHNTSIKYPNITAAGYSTASNGVLSVGQTGNYGYGSMTMEKSFRDCSISACGSSSGASEALSHNFGWVGLDPAYSSSNYSSLFDHKKRFIDGILEEEEDQEYEEDNQHIETLPLFPMHAGEDINSFCTNMKPQPDSCYSGWYMSDDYHAYTTTGSHRASLELSLNSYTTARSQD